jgi:hypothetical protein
MWIIRRPSKPPTAFEYAVIVVGLAGLLVAFGGVALVAAALAPPEKHDIAAGLVWYGGWSLGLGVALAAAYWLVRRLAE